MTWSRLQSRLLSLARFGGRLSLAAIHIFVLMLVVWQVLRFYPGDRWFPVRLGSYFVPWLVMALFPALAIALLGRHRWLVIVIVLLILIVGGRYWPLFVPSPTVANAAINAGELRVMTFNVHYANRNVEAIIRLLNKENPDIIVVQEFTPGLAGPLLPQVAADYPHQLISNSWGQAILSRYPLTAQPNLPGLRHLLRAYVKTPEGVISVWNIHPPTAIHQAGWEFQQRMLTAVAEAVDLESDPLIVLGDFNTTAEAENYRLLATRLTDVHYAVGQGFGFTFPEPNFLYLLRWYGEPFGQIEPIVRIDHILVSEHLIPQESHVVLDGFGSDHRPVVATLRFKK